QTRCQGCRPFYLSPPRWRPGSLLFRTRHECCFSCPPNTSSNKVPDSDRRPVMSRTVAEHLVDVLAQAGIQRIYGVVGDSLNPVTDALRRSTLEWVDVRHEETAAFAAGAEAQLTGNLAVCAGSCGPGNLHL